MWIAAVKRIRVGSRDSIWTPGHHEVLCSKHFLKTDYIPNVSIRKLRRTAVPSVFSHTNTKEAPTTSRTLRYVENYGQAPIIVQEPRSSGAELGERLSRYRTNLHNVRRRERRLRTTVDSLRSDLQKVVEINRSLNEHLEIFKGENA